MHREAGPVERGDPQARRDAAAGNVVAPEHVAATERLQPTLRRGRSAEGRPVVVRRARSGSERAAPAGEAQPQRELDVLPVREECLVEAPGCSERRRPVRGRAPARSDRLPLADFRRRAIPTAVPRPERGVELDPGGVDQLGRVSLEEDARDHADRRVGERLEQSVEKAGLAHAVVVHQHERFAGGSLFREALVDGTAKADVAGQADDLDVRVPLRHGLGGSVARSVVDDHDLGWGNGLGGEAVERLQQQIASVDRGYDDDRAHATGHDTRMLRVVMWSSDPVGERMAGPGIRYHRLAGELARRFDVTLVGPGDGPLADAGYRFRHVATVGSPAELDADVVVAQQLPLRVARTLKRSGARLVYDLYVPAFVEASALLAGEAGDARARGLRYDEVVRLHEVALGLGDAFICASERQRDHWLGALGLAGRLEPDVYVADPSLRTLIAVVPFGLDLPEGPAPAATLAGVADGDRVLLWGGGIWNWLDPLTVIRAVARIASRRDDVKLVFLGGRHPSTAVGAMTMTERARGLAAELGLLHRHVVFGDDWVPYEQRRGAFARADLGVSAHVDGAEARLAFRTRLLDHIAAGTPLVVTRGDVLGELVESRGMGRAVDPDDVDGWVSAVDELLDDAAGRAARKAVEMARPELAWSRAARPLVDLVATVAAAPPRTDASDAALVRAALTLVRSSVARRGLRGTLVAGGRAVSGGTRR